MLFRSGRLQQMLMAETSLGELASVKMSAPAPAPAPARNREERGPLDWSELQLRVTQVLRAPKAVDFGGACRPCTKTWPAAASRRQTPLCWH